MGLFDFLKKTNADNPPKAEPPKKAVPAETRPAPQPVGAPSGDAARKPAQSPAARSASASPGAPPSPRQAVRPPVSQPRSAPTPRAAARYRIATQIAPIQRVPNPPRTTPAEGAAVLAANMNQRLILKKAVMTDSTSITFLTSDSRYMAKIYIAPVLAIDWTEKKIRRMLADPISIPGVCWPVDELHDANGRFVGALVPASGGTQLTKCILQGKNGLTAAFPRWDKRDLCRLSATILNAIKQLGDNGVLFGYLNPASIYVARPEEVYFVDMDSWQIEGYPCQAVNQTFSAPEILRTRANRYLASMDEENYQVAVLLFMLLMPGKFPYSKKKTTDEAQSIVDMAFPFRPEGRQGARDTETPSGVWQMVWDHLSLQLRIKFFNTFSPNGRNAQPGTRLPAADWINAVGSYLAKLNEPDHAESRALFPATFRHDGQRVFSRCSICGKEHPQEYFMHFIYIKKEKVDVWSRGYRICLPCSHDQSQDGFTCQCCGVTFYYTNRTKVLHEIGRLDFDYKQQRWCRDCKKIKKMCPSCGREVPLYQMTTFEDRRRNQTKTMCGDCKRKLIEEATRQRNTVVARIRCQSCGSIFDFTSADEEFYRSKGWNRPTRCKNCRAKR